MRVTLRFVPRTELTFRSKSTGLPASFGDPDESDPESEVEDEGDEDSNGQLALTTNLLPFLTQLSSRRLVHQRLPGRRRRRFRRSPLGHWQVSYTLASYRSNPFLDEDEGESGLEVEDDDGSDDEWMSSQLYKQR